MRSPTLQILATSLLAGSAFATSAPTCVSSSEGYQVGQVDYLFNAFCNQLSSNKFATEQQIYGLPVISFDFTSAGTSETCDLDNCLASYQTLIKSCALPNSTIWGTGSIDAGCGVYNFSIWNTASSPTLGTPTTTLEGSTMTTAPPITLTSTTSSSTSLSSSSVSSPTSTSATTTATPSSLTAIFYEYSNSTSASSSSTSGVAYSTGAVVSTSASESKTFAATTPSPTKPAVGSTALGTSGADILRASGFSLIAVACVFGWWM